MKDQSSNLLKWVLGGGVFCVLITAIEVGIVKLTTYNYPENYEAYLPIMITITMCAYSIVTMVKYVQYQKWHKEYRREILEGAKEELGSEFKTVLLNSSDAISKEKFQCQAKVDSDGKIVCKIYVDFETKVDSYEEFLRYFHFAE